MMKNLFVSISLALLFVGCVHKENALTVTQLTVHSPLESFEVVIPVFDGCPEYLITEFGATPNDQEKNTLAIAKAIESASANGGGVVVIPKGEWLTGKLHLKSNVNLHLNKGATLLFSDNPEDYLPAVFTSWEGMECYNYSPLIYAYECTNIAITGEGKVEAKMGTWSKWFSRPEAHMNSLKRLYNLASYNTPVEERQMVNDTANFRPHFIQFNRCENVLLEGVSVSKSPFWTIHPYMSKSVVIRNINVWAHGHNNDGVDPEMCQNVLIENCVFDQGDDAIAVKSGRNQDAWRLNTPTKNIVIRNCTIKNGHQLLAIGSELSGGIENVFMDSCVVDSAAKMFHLVFIKTNERRGGYVKNIMVRNIESGNMKEGILGIETDVMYQWRTLVSTIERKLTPISDVTLQNVHASNVKFISRILGQEELPVQNIALYNVAADTIRYTKHIHENVIGVTKNNPFQE